MSTVHPIRNVLFLAVSLLAATIARAADVLESIPDTALAVVIVNHAEEMSDKIDRLAKQVHAPAVSVLTTIKLQAGMHEGLDDKGTVALALLPAKDAAAPPQAVLLLPVTDYDKFLAQFQPDDVAKPIARIRLAGAPMLIGKRGSYAVLAAADSQDALADVLASVKDVSSELSPLKTWLGEADAVAVATPAGIKLALERALPLLPLIRLSLQNVAQQPAQAQMLSQFLDALEAGLKTFQSEVTHLALAFRADENQNVRFTVRARFAPGGNWAAAGKGLKPPKEGLLAGLPGGPYALAYGAMLPPSWHALIGNQIGSFMKIDPMFSRLPAEQQAKLALAAVEMIEPIESMSILMGTAPAGDPLYGKTVAQMKVDDAKKYLDQYTAAIQLFNETMKDPQVGSLAYEAKAIDVDGRPALDITTDLSKFTQPGAVDIKPVFEKMFGPGDRVHTYLAAADDKTLVMSYVSLENLKRALAAAKAPAQGLVADPQTAETTALMPQGAQWIGYASGQGLLSLGQSVLAAVPGGAPAKLPEMRSAAPIGMSAKLTPAGMNLDLVAPASTLDAIGELVAKLRGGR
jgi:hypothetical protein